MSTVSIIMPVYNGEQFITQAIDSVLDQTWQDWELVVIDDGSTDGTADIVSAYDDPRIRYIYQENQGQPAALNRGLEAVKGSYVTTLDADDWLGPSSLKDRAVCLEEHPEFGAVYCDGYYCSPSGDILKRFSDERYSDNVTGDIYDALVISSLYSAGSSVMIRREVIDQHQLRYDESIVWCQDWDFYIRVAEWARFGYVGSPSVYYRLHDTNMTMTMPKGRRLQSLIRTSRKVLDSPRFARVSLDQKRAFFYRFLVNDLVGHIEQQKDVINSAAFQALPRREQATLLRWIATSYLLDGVQSDFVKELLQSTWKLAPLDLKASLLISASMINFDLAVSLTRFWGKRGRGEISSPFESLEDVRSDQSGD